jgi:hypothetical protein
MALPELFPLPKEEDKDDRNPAIRLFGKRFIGEQGPLELVAEFLAVAQCEKRLGGNVVDGPLPSMALLRSWPDRQQLEYRPPVKLNLKLFSFLAASRLDTRHDAHREQYTLLAERLRQRIEMAHGSPGEVVEWLEELLRGFQGAGFNRAWCAQTFFPVSARLLTKETIWQVTAAKADGIGHWGKIAANPNRYFATSRRDYLARGGELLYLQLCNALRTGEPVAQFARQLQSQVRGSLSQTEADPAALHEALVRGFANLQSPRMAAFDKLVDLVETLDRETHDRTNPQGADEGWLSCQWCPADSWPEGYLFAVELSRLLQVAVAPVERLELMTMGAVLQVMRSLCAQSARHDGTPPPPGSPLGYSWLFTPPEGASRPLRLASQRNLQSVQRLIYRALRSEELAKNAYGGKKSPAAIYSEADRRYGHKLLLSLGKKLGLIAPNRGPAARFVMTDGLLRYLVLALLRPGERCTYENFLQRLFLHYGIAVQGEALDQAAAWSGVPPNSSLQPADGGWLAGALRAGGFLAELSDGCSIVRNSYRATEPEGMGVQS